VQKIQATFCSTSKSWSAKLLFELKTTKCWLNGCTFDHLSSFLPWRTASVHFFFTKEEQTAIKIPQFLKTSETEGFLFKLLLLALCCALRDHQEKSISKSTPVRSDQGQGL